MLLEVSIGEAVDKLSILELKSKYIKDENKRNEVNKEIKSINNIIVYRDKYRLLYKLLYNINEKIWTYQDHIVSNKIKDSELVNYYNIVFKLNQQRFRIKNILNNLENGIKEQKGYNPKTVYILFDNNLINEVTAALLYIMLDYDIIYTAHDVPILNPFIVKKELSSFDKIDTINLHDIKIPSNDINFYNMLNK